MKKSHCGLALVLLLIFPAQRGAARAPALSPDAAPAKQEKAPPEMQHTPAQTSSAATPKENAQPIVTAYTLPADRYKKAHDLATIRFRLNLIGFVYGVVVLWLILRWKLGPKYRDWAEHSSVNRFVQALIFTPPLLLTVDVLELPTGMYEHWLSRKFGLSVQGWRSWFWDWTKGEIIGIVLGIVLVWILYSVIRKAGRRWWFYFWLVSLPLGLFLFFLQPMVIDPMFHKFEPLPQKDPALTAALEQMVQRAGQDIPPRRMFWMGAGEKTTALNAYVTGFGASKRIVVWDTTIAKMTTPQIVFVAGHEMGHYVLQHIPKLLAFGAVSLFVLFFLAYKTIGWLLSRFGPDWGIRGLEDWASLPALLLLITIFGFAASPIGSAVSRHYEHQADQYGLEVTHGLTPDSSQVAAQGFQILGEVNLADPDPNPLDVFLFYSHPPIGERVHFALAYDPWANGGHGEFVH